MVSHRRHPCMREDAWHRNNRRLRQVAKGLIEAAKQGLDIPPETVEAAKQLLAAHHGTDKQTMSAWEAQRQMQSMMEEMNNLNYLLTGTRRTAPHHFGKTSWGKGGNPNGKGGMKGGSKGGAKGKGKGGKADAKAAGGKGNQDITQTPGPCRGCGGIHWRSECPAFINQTVCQNCWKPGHLTSHCRSSTIDETTICKCCGEAGHAKRD